MRTMHALAAVALLMAQTAHGQRPGPSPAPVPAHDSCAAAGFGLEQSAYLKASTSGVADVFGWSVGVSGDTLVVGARLEDSAATGVDGDQTDGGASQSGAAYVFVRGAGGWEQEAYLKASNTGAGDELGIAVAVSGDTVVVGAHYEDSAATGVDGDGSSDAAVDSGAVYVFVRGPGGWEQQAYLKASNTGAGDLFGLAVAIDGDTIVVGAEGEDSAASGVDGDPSSNGAPSSGAAYVFVRSGTTWTQQAYLKASNTGTADRFGHAVSISGDRILVGAPEEDSAATGIDGDESSNAAELSGAAYLFARSGTTWTQRAYVKSSNSDAFDRFGSAVAIDGLRAVIGAPFEDSATSGVDGDQADDSLASAGAAYVFVRDAAGWSQEAYLKASNPDASDRFGGVVAFAGNRAAVGARFESSDATGVNGDQASNAAEAAGAAYVFARLPEGWSQTRYLKASNTQESDVFGGALAAGGGALVVGATLEDSDATGVDGDQSNDDAPGSGAVYVFEAGPKATVGFRNAGTNRATYAAAAPVVGGTFSASVDNTPAGQTTSLLFAFDTPASIVLGGGQVLLCQDLGGGEILTGASLAPSSSAGGIDSYLAPIPADPALCGLTIFSQAIQLGVPPFALSNAQDLTFGNFD